jgi:hypothetical protein
MTEIPVTRYARSGDVSIAYQVMGGGGVARADPDGFLLRSEEERAAQNVSS